MDKVLNREESLQLMDLLGLERSAWGNIPLMRKAYLKKCKEFHPDKGGDEEKMKKMNTLYKKMEDGVKYAHQPDFGGFWDATEVFASSINPGVDAIYCKQWPECAKKMSTNCICLLCLLRMKHENRKLYRKDPLVWVDCYCFDCFRMWFGLDLCEGTLLLWCDIIGQTTYRDLKL